MTPALPQARLSHRFASAAAYRHPQQCTAASSARREQILVAHPYNPVYLLPIVEVVPSAVVPEETVQRAEALLTDIGMKPITLRAEIPAHVGDRLLEAVWREALWLIKDGVATTEQIDDLMTHGFGLRLSLIHI